MRMGLNKECIRQRVKMKENGMVAERKTECVREMTELNVNETQKPRV